VYIAPGNKDPTQYTQIAISPYNTQFVAKILNPYFNGTNLQTSLQSCSTVTSRASPDPTKQEYNGQMLLPWAWLMAAYPNAASQPGVRTVKGVDSQGLPINVPATWRGNFFRIAMRNNVSTCTFDDCDYGAWSPTYSQSFHMSAYFGQIDLIDNTSSAQLVTPLLSLILALAAALLL